MAGTENERGATPDRLAMSMVANRLFCHRLLAALIDAGVFSQQQAASVATVTAEDIRHILDGPGEEPFAEALARGYEGVAAAMLGLPPVSPSST